MHAHVQRASSAEFIIGSMLY